MKQHRLFRVFFACLALLIACPTVMAATKEKKEKKEKKSWTWTLPELSGDKDFDMYLLTCDTLDARINSYRDSITWFSVKQVKDEDGKIIMAVVDENNNIRSSSEALLQYLQMINSGLGIAADLANITACTVAATNSLANLRVNPIIYTKYLKYGPKIVANGGKEAVEIVKKCRQQAKAIRVLKKNFNEKGELINPSMDLSNIDGVNFAEKEVVEKSKAEVEQALAAAAITDVEIGAVDLDDPGFNE